jgi:4-alpha-glucanotransferase
MNRNLAALARLYGVQTFYIDMKRERREAEPESVLLALRALGAPVDAMDDVDSALRHRRRELEEHAVEPVILAWDGRLPTRNIPARSRQKTILTLEDGSVAVWPPARLPYGYHRLDVGSRQSLVISAPRQAHFPIEGKSWGVFAPVYALHSSRTNGAGDLTDLESLVDWMHERGGRVAGTLPLLSNFMEQPYDPSPYAPASRIFWNEFYVDPARSPEFELSAKARRLADKPILRPPLIDYARTMAAKRRVLAELAKTFFDCGRPDRRSAFETFSRANPAVEDYARFRAVTDRRRAGWRSWPERLRAGEIRSDDYDENDRRYHLYAQWLAQQQIAALAQKTKTQGSFLYLDLPLGMHADSYDTWRHHAFFVEGMAAGAPPDPVFTLGQNWGFPPMHPRAMRANKHQYTIAYIRNHLRHCGLLRIDHVMGLHRLYWIPDGLSGAQGVYVEYPAEELYAILSLESHRNQAGIIGENLGTVPPEVNAAMARHNIRPMYVVQYEIVEEGNEHTLRPPVPGAMASVNTHDMSPFQAFLNGDDIPDRLDLKFLDPKGAKVEAKTRVQVRKALTKSLKARKPDQLLNACLEFLGKSKASIVLVNLEDLWKETKPQNTPATTNEQRPNWRRRLRYSLEQIKRSAEIKQLLLKLNEVRNT